MKQLLPYLFAQNTLSREEAKAVLLEISKGRYNDALLASFLTVYKMRPITGPELQGFRDALLELCVSIDLGDMDSIDIVGTGGDGKNTFNISTLSCFVVAGAGYPVTKHGNYGVSSVSGSSNVLESLGYKFTNDQGELTRRLEASNIVFLHAPLFHPAMKAVGPVRKALAMKTFFNMLGPLVNPAQPKRYFLGVFSSDLLPLYQYILKADQSDFAVVYDLAGFDEISLTGDFNLHTSEGEQVLSPTDLGLSQHDAEALFGGDTVREATEIFVNILEGRGSTAQNEVVFANAGMAIHRFKSSDTSFADSIAEAKDSLLAGKALKTLREAIASCG